MFFFKAETPASFFADLMLAPAVVAMRLPLMAAEARAGNGAPMVETMLAVSEKAEAMVEGALAAQLSLFVSATKFWPAVLAGKEPSGLVHGAAERSLKAALKPAGRTVRANYRRLSKA